MKKYTYIAYDRYSELYMSEETAATIAHYMQKSVSALTRQFQKNNDVIIYGNYRFERLIETESKEEKLC